MAIPINNIQYIVSFNFWLKIHHLLNKNLAKEILLARIKKEWQILLANVNSLAELIKFPYKSEKEDTTFKNST